MEYHRRLAGPDEEESLVAWLMLIISIGFLLAMDMTFLHKPLSTGRVVFGTAVKLTLFWVMMGLLFNLFILGYFGWDSSLSFLEGYFLEYMLSFDNLFVFHLVFSYYCTPEALLYRALYFGIAGAIVLRFVFLFVGWIFMTSGLYIVKVALGGILIWSGIKSAKDSDDEESRNPTKNMFVAWVTKHLPVSDNYEPHGHFFMSVMEEPPAAAANMSSLPRLESFEGSSLLEPSRGGLQRDASMEGWPSRTPDDSFEVMRKPARVTKKASLLLIVVATVWMVDLVFAVDSVASKLGSIDDFFLNFSSAAFAMLSLRPLYFVMESLIETFQMLRYGIAAILILIGLKLIFGFMISLSSSVCFAIICAICAASIASSYWMPRFRENCETIDRGTLDAISEEAEEEGMDDRRRKLQGDGIDFRKEDVEGSGVRPLATQAEEAEAPE
mmetsp:Transcript_60559/g.131247  ORF Transcript_60559/g.131247 Transcript_60559/m.131247 type:complete len:441 (-) Transcript_60559:50-1372(-)